jgi:hypothetical protein
MARIRPPVFPRTLRPATTLTRPEVLVRKLVHGLRRYIVLSSIIVEGQIQILPCGLGTGQISLSSYLIFISNSL